MKKKILVTGGAGFVGSHLVERLLKEGNYLICLDDFTTGNKKNIAHLFSNPDFELLEQDICTPFDLNVNEIYNLACPASPKHYQADPIKTLKTSVLGAINVLELAKRSKAKVFQASTSEVYGDPEIHPQVEEYWGHVNPIGIRSCYDEGKRCSETLFFDYFRKGGVSIKVGRIFNTYGPRMLPEDGRVISNFIVQALKGEDLTIYGDGKQTRSFCYVSDLVDVIIKFMATDFKITGPINLGNPGEFTILELAEKLLKLINTKSKISFKSLPADDPKLRRPDISKAKKLLNWEPTVSLNEGLKSTIAYFENYCIKREI